MTNSYVSIVTTSMGRLDSLKQSVPLMLQQGSSTELIVVDYSCPLGSGSWVEENYPAAKVVRCPGERFFNLSAARNAGARAAQKHCHSFLLFADADILLEDRFVEFSLRGSAPYEYYVDRRHSVFNGTVMVDRELFDKVWGYDPALMKYGGSHEDVDLYMRLEMAGAKRAYFPMTMMTHVDHPDEQRVMHYRLQHRHIIRAVNQIYVNVKGDILKMCGRLELPPATREQLYERIFRACLKAFRTKEAGFSVDLAGYGPTYGSRVGRALHYKIDSNFLAEEGLSRKEFDKLCAGW